MKKKGYFGSNFKMYKNAAATEEYLKAITAATADISRDDYQFFSFLPIRRWNVLQKALSEANSCWAPRICAGNPRDSSPERSPLRC